jgi:hypothetical protein
MRRIVLSLLAVVVIAGLFAAAGHAGYRFGYAQGAQGAPSTANGDDIPRPGLRPFDDFGPRGMPGRDFGFDREFHRGFGVRGFPMLRFGLFSPLMFLGQILVLALIAGLVYWLFTRSGWQLTRTVQTTETPAQPVETEVKNRNSESED